jgi:ubiquinone/menaquinone biosynthesis C-methylase UbiE
MSVDEVIGARRPRSVLDVGAGDGAWLAGMADRLPAGSLLVGADLSAPTSSAATVRSVRADAARLPVRDRAVAAVVARAVLHHVADPGATVRELARAVGDSGVLVVRDATAIPATLADELQAYLIARGHPPEPHAGIDPDEVAGAARDAGLRIEVLDRAAGTAMLAGPRFATPAFELVATRRRST